MSTDHLLAGAQTLTLGVDGFRPVGWVNSDGCCPPSLCQDMCDLTCSFLDLLPSGPMWDYHKRAARDYVSAGGDITECDMIGCVTQDCPSMVMYAVYASRVLHDLISNMAWPAIREANPHTAVTTIDSWLERYGWRDCYRSPCLDQMQLKYSPYLVDGPCGKMYQAPVFDSAFECALKHNILRALVRRQRGVLRNLDGLNWIIQPLGVQLSPRQPYPFDLTCQDDGIPSCHCDVAEFTLTPISETLVGCPNIMPCLPATSVPAKQAHGNAMIYPGLYAADCLLRSMMPYSCVNKIFH